MKHFVVVGAGQAGQALVTKLRNLGFEGKVTLIGEEPVPPYQRPPLSKKYLLGKMEVERLFLRPESYYSENQIDLLLGQTVTSIDSAAKELHLGDRAISYDELALTTGATPRCLPAAIGGDLDGVYGVRTLADVNKMAPEFQSGRRLLIVGGGYIGLEAAAVAARKGLSVTLVEMSDRILQRVAARETSDFLRAVHEREGVRILENTGLKALRGEGRVTSALLSDGTEIPTDFAVVGVGVTPNTGLAEKVNLAVENGIVTDKFCRTSDPSIWAAGDCASFPYRGARIRLESVGNAVDQAELIAENMLGANKEYVAKPWFWSDQYDIKLQIAGLNTGYDSVVIRKGEKLDSISFWYYREATLLAVDAINDPRAYMVGKRLIEMGKTPDARRVSDPDTDLKDLLKA